MINQTKNDEQSSNSLTINHENEEYLPRIERYERKLLL